MRKLRPFSFGCLSLVLSIVCLATEARAQEAKLTRLEAEARKARVSNVHYDLSLQFREKQTAYSGEVTIEFDYRKPRTPEPLRIDFDRGRIVRAILNGAETAPAAIDSGTTAFLAVPAAALADGHNRLTLAFEHAYSTIGKGLYRFLDTEDQQEYLYTDLEPYGANQVFPCFDQPDLKAVIKLQVEAPARWQIVGNGEEEAVQADGTRKFASFKPTAPISTYVFAVIAGPYEVWSDHYRSVPIRVFARKSMSRFVGIQEWLDITKKGLAFYEQTFHYPYPFGKYDQILVPDFGPGAMENVGAVTFNEAIYVFRSPPTTKQKMVLAETVLHEMAHMWFGDLVTMKWWNNLWLNESFATYMSLLAVKALGDYDPRAVDVYFFANTKKWAYFEDGLHTTHPIEVNVPDTSEALANFDGITYGKGGSTLKQLHYLLGDQAFKQGLQSYFRKYQYQNTELTDFVGELAQASGRDLGEWQKQWLQSKGTNTVQATWSCEGPELRSITLTQGDAPNADALARSHRAELGLYVLTGLAEDAPVTAAKIVPVTYSGRQTTVPATGPCPDFIYPNEGDHDFAKTIFTPGTVERIAPRVSRFTDPLTRQLVWYSLWTQVEFGTMPASRYLEIALKNLPLENDLQTVEEIVNNLLGERYQDLSVSKILKPADRAPVYDRLWTLAQSELAKQAPGSSEQRMWLRIALRSTRSPESVAWTRRVLDGTLAIPGQKIEYDLRWDFVDALAVAGGLDQVAIRKEIGADDSDSTMDRALRALGELDEPKLNPTLFRMFLGEKVQDAEAVSFLLPSTLSPSRLQQAMKGYYSLLHEDKVAAVAPGYFARTASMPHDLGENFMWDYGYNLYPSTCDGHADQGREKFFAESDRLFPVLAREARNAREVELRCVKARALEYAAGKH